MLEQIALDQLTQDSVSVKKQNFTIVDGVNFSIGEPWRCAYVNSTFGRQAAQAEIPEPFLTAILALWGSVPTVTE